MKHKLMILILLTNLLAYISKYLIETDLTIYESTFLQQIYKD